jgi:hypothetical protein
VLLTPAKKLGPGSAASDFRTPAAAFILGPILGTGHLMILRRQKNSTSVTLTVSSTLRERVDVTFSHGSS